MCRIWRVIDVCEITPSSREHEWAKSHTCDKMLSKEPYVVKRAICLICVRMCETHMYEMYESHTSHNMLSHVWDLTHSCCHMCESQTSHRDSYVWDVWVSHISQHERVKSHTCDNMNVSHTSHNMNESLCMTCMSLTHLTTWMSRTHLNKSRHTEKAASQEKGGVSEEDMSCDMHDSHHIQLKTSCHTNSDVPSAKGDNRNESSYTHIWTSQVTQKRMYLK